MIFRVDMSIPIMCGLRLVDIVFLVRTRLCLLSFNSQTYVLCCRFHMWVIGLAEWEGFGRAVEDLYVHVLRRFRLLSYFNM